MAKDKIPTFQFSLDEDDAMSGIKAVALVDVPAIDSKAFSLVSRKVDSLRLMIKV